MNLFDDQGNLIIIDSFYLRDYDNEEIGEKYQILRFKPINDLDKTLNIII
jgi:hypothetical protein